MLPLIVFTPCLDDGFLLHVTCFKSENTLWLLKDPLHSRHQKKWKREREERGRKEGRNVRGSCFCVSKQNQLWRQKTWYFNLRKYFSRVKQDNHKMKGGQIIFLTVTVDAQWPLNSACLDRTPCRCLVHSHEPALTASSRSRMAPHRNGLPASEGSSQSLQSLQWAHWWCAALSLKPELLGKEKFFVTIMGWIFQKAEWKS